MTYRFADCTLDPVTHEFRAHDDTVAMEPQVFDLLHLFVQNPGRLITREEIIEQIWAGRIVSDAAISSRINAVRRAVGDTGRDQRVLQTVPRLGFRFVAEVEEAPAASGYTPLTPPLHQEVRVTASADGAQIAFATTGTGPPLMRAGHFLTHLEFDWQSLIWNPQLHYLSQRFALTRYDQRGTGLSDEAPPGYGLDALVDDMRAVADGAGLTRFPIFASSQGVPVSVAFSARYPERVSRMVLYGGYVRGRMVKGAADREKAQAIQTIIREGWGRAGSTFATMFATIYMPDGRRAELDDMTKVQLASASAENAVALRAGIDLLDVSDLLDQVRAPALVLHCREDAMHPLSEARALASGLPDARLQVLDGRSHVLLPGRPEWQTGHDAVAAFLGDGDD